MSTTRRKFSKEFKAKVVLESLKERFTLEVIPPSFLADQVRVSLLVFMKLYAKMQGPFGTALQTT